MLRPTCLQRASQQAEATESFFRQTPQNSVAFSNLYLLRNPLSTLETEHQVTRKELNVVDFAQPLGPLQHFPRLAAIRRADDPIAMHHIENARGAAISQPKPPLQG